MRKEAKLFSSMTALSIIILLECVVGDLGGREGGEEDGNGDDVGDVGCGEGGGEGR